MRHKKTPLPTLFPVCLVLAMVLPVACLNAQEVIDEPNPFREVDGQRKAEAPLEDVRPEDVRPEDFRPENILPGNERSGEGANAPLNAQISQHILKLAEAERDKRMGFMQIVIDDIVRLCNLDAAQRERLELAAKGAAARSMKEWHEQAERYFRTRLEITEGDAAKEMLEGMGNVNFGGNRSEEEGESLDLWKDALKDVLTKEQVAEYEGVLEQRHLDRIDAFARMSLTTIDTHLRLTPEQKTKMAEVVHESAVDYLDDVQRFWGDYFEKGMLMSLANSAEEDRLKAILTEPQYERLREATTSFDHFWDQKRRLKRAKEKAAERRKAGAEEKESGEKEAVNEAGVNLREIPAVRIRGGAGIRVQGGVTVKDQ